MKTNRNLLLLNVIIIFSAKVVAKSVLKQDNDKLDSFKEDENILRNDMLQFKDPPLMKNGILLDSSLDLLQAHDSKVNAKYKMKPKKREELSKNGNSVVNNVENFTENIGSDTEIDTDLDNSEILSINDPINKQDFIPYNNFSNQTNQIVDTLLKNLVNCYNYSNDQPNGPFPVNIFLGSNISVMNYIFLPSNATNGFNTEGQSISESSSIAETTLSSVTLEQTEENIENVSVTDISQMGTTQLLTSELELDESTTSLSSNGITSSISSDTVGSSIPLTEEVTNTGIMDSTPLNDSSSETESNSNCVSSENKTCPTTVATVATICYTVAIDQESSNIVVTEPLQTTESGVKTTPLSSISPADSIVATTAGLKRNKISKQKSATTYVKNMKKPPVKSKQRAKKHRNGDSKHKHLKRKEI